MGRRGSEDSATSEVASLYLVLGIGSATPHRYDNEAMRTLLDDLDAFLQEHRRWGELESGVEAEQVWMTCECGAVLRRPLDEPSRDK